MPRRKVDQWGITYVIPVWRTGYTWWSPDDQTEPKLIPEGGTIVFSHEPAISDLDPMVNPTLEKSGLAFSRRAFNEFRRLSEKLTEPIGDEAARALVLEFANEFGPLGEHFVGIDGHGSEILRHWKQEASVFLDMLDVSKAIRRADFAAFSRRISVRSERTYVYGRTMFYRGSRPGSREYSIAHEAAVTRTLNLPNIVGRQLSDFDKAFQGGPRVQATMLLSKVANQRLIGGLSFKPSWVDSSQFFFTPASLLPLVYLKLWIDTVKEEEIDRQMTCWTCDKPLEGRRSKKFCNDTCRNAFHNRRRAAAT